VYEELAERWAHHRCAQKLTWVSGVTMVTLSFLGMSRSGMSGT
jgi:hypothetical protein